MEPCRVFFLMQSLADLPAGERWLSAGERARAAALRFPKRRSDWLLGRWTAKLALRSFLARTGLHIAGFPELEIRSAPDGAPEPFLGSKAAPLSMALSHSAGRGFCVVARSGIALGCDLESIQARNPEFIADYLVDEERQLIAGVPPDLQALTATLIWSAKESALKCLREGLRRDTRSVQVSLNDDCAPGWKALHVRCLESSRLFYGWWRYAGGQIQTITAGLPVHEPEELQV